MVFKSVDFKSANFTEVNFVNTDIKNSNFHTAIVDENDPRLPVWMSPDAEIVYTVEQVSKLVAEKSALLKKYLRDAEELEATSNLIEEKTTSIRKALESIGSI